MRILVIDDVWTEALLLGQALHEQGHRAVVALDPATAADLVDDETDAVIAGIDKLGRAAILLARRIHAERPDLPIVFRSLRRSTCESLRAAQRMGPVLGRGWSARELQHVVACLVRMCERRGAASGTAPAAAAR